MHLLLNSGFDSTNDLCMHSLVHSFIYSFPCATLPSADFGERDRAVTVETVGHSRLEWLGAGLGTQPLHGGSVQE